MSGSASGASVRVTFRGQKEQVAHFYNAGPAVISAMLKKMPSFEEALLEEARQNTNSKTGMLAASLYTKTVATQNKVIVSISTEGVPYALAQEKGVTIPAHEIAVVNAKALAWTGGFAGGSDTNFAVSVKHPGGTIPPKHYILRALERYRSEFRDLALQSGYEAMEVPAV